jgi:hypothetical protein
MVGVENRDGITQSAAAVGAGIVGSSPAWVPPQRKTRVSVAVVA